MEGPPRGLLWPERFLGKSKAGRGSQRPRQASLPVRQLDCTKEICSANSRPFVAAQGQFAPDAEQFGSMKLIFVIEVDFRPSENGHGLPGATGNGQASCKLCLQDRMENTV